jgi:ribonuclease HI
VAIFAGNEVAAQVKFKLDKKCSNNQAEQLAIPKALEAIETLDITENGPYTAAIFADNRITIDSLKNINSHNFLIEEIRKKVSILETANWVIEFSCVKVHVGTYGYELADLLAKETARNRDATISYNKIPKGTLMSETEEESIQKWQKERNECTKATITKPFFPNVHDRLKMKINVTPNFAAMVTGHGKTGANFYRFKIMEQATCPYDSGDQTVDHLLYQCTLLHTSRKLLRNSALKTGNWPANEQELTTKHLKAFLTYTNSIDFEQL